jgi:hypothetical protein
MTAGQGASNNRHRLGGSSRFRILRQLRCAKAFLLVTQQLDSGISTLLPARQQNGDWPGTMPCLYPFFAEAPKNGDRFATMPCLYPFLRRAPILSLFQTRKKVE